MSAPLTLQSLASYAAHQEELIRSLMEDNPGDNLFRDPKMKGWTTFWESCWGKPVGHEMEEKVVRGPAPISDSLIFPDVVPFVRRVVLKPTSLDNIWGGFRCKKFLIRHEYKEADEFLLSTFNDEGIFTAVIATGQPGIGLSFSYQTIPGSEGLSLGKSVFLLLTLLSRLELKLPTVLQFSLQQPLLFYQNGVKELVLPGFGPAYASLMSWDLPLARIWALVDTNRHLHEPAPALTDGPFFVVEATSPRQTRFDWTSRFRTDNFYMKPWAFSEVLQV